MSLLSLPKGLHALDAWIKFFDAKQNFQPPNASWFEGKTLPLRGVDGYFRPFRESVWIVADRAYILHNDFDIASFRAV